jgi:acyl carrier protein
MNERTIEQIREKVTLAVCDSLALKPGEARGDSLLVDDLGMDSLDFLDIMFLLEKDYDRKIRDADFDRVLRPDPAEIAKMDPFLSAEEIVELSELMPLLTEASKERKIKRQDLFSFVTVETLVKLVARKVQQ